MIPWRTVGLGAAVLASCGMGVAGAAESNRFWLAAQHHWAENKGFYLNFENESPAGPCQLGELRLILGVADGHTWRYMTVRRAWEPDREYRVRATISPQVAELWLDGERLAQTEGAFQPAAAPLEAGQTPDWASGQAEYLIMQSWLALRPEGGEQTRVEFPDARQQPLALLLFQPSSPRALAWSAPADRLFAIEAAFRVVRRPDLHSLAPLVDRFGQAGRADWPGKVRTDDDLRTDVRAEAEALARLPPSPDVDRFGGYRKAGWSEPATGFFRVLRRNGFWWLLSPDGNPCFYAGMNSAPGSTWELTPVSDREWLFAELPPRTDPWAAAWGRNAWGGQDGTEYVCFQTANLIRKYGAEWRTRADAAAAERLRAWGFTGGGKWGTPAGLVSTPVLHHWGAPNLVRHPDVFDEAICRRFRQTLEEQIAPRRDDPLVLGWSLGNEYDEIVTGQEIRDILAKPAATPAKQALLAHALDALHGGDLGRLAAAWGLTLDGREALMQAAPVPPGPDLEQLRRFYATRYYEFVYRTVKELDPNHLYLGFWIVPGWWENDSDWTISAPYCDVIGYDRYAPDFLDERLAQLFKVADKPVLCGEFSFPPLYNGERGFGRYGTWARDDADAGELYRRWVAATATTPQCVGVQWFQYRDQPLTGRGPGRGSALVYGEHVAFGVVTLADRCKWDLVTAMREANLRAVTDRLQAAAGGR